MSSTTVDPQLQRYLEYHAIDCVARPTSVCHACLAASALYRYPFGFCAPCFEKFLSDSVEWQEAEKRMGDGHRCCQFCLRDWDCMPEEERSDGLEDPKGRAICLRCDSELCWTGNRCTSCDKRVDVREGALKVDMPWIDFLVCEECADKRADGARFARLKRECLWCDNPGDGQLLEDDTHRAGRVCARHSIEKYWRAKRFVGIRGYGNWLRKNHPGASVKIYKKKKSAITKTS